jgi:hypothetical protein
MRFRVRALLEVAQGVGQFVMDARQELAMVDLSGNLVPELLDPRKEAVDDLVRRW